MVWDETDVARVRREAVVSLILDGRGDALGVWSALLHTTYMLLCSYLCSW